MAKKFVGGVEITLEMATAGEMALFEAECAHLSLIEKARLVFLAMECARENADDPLSCPLDRLNP